jgi:hypothetical protein
MSIKIPGNSKRAYFANQAARRKIVIRRENFHENEKNIFTRENGY